MNYYPYGSDLSTYGSAELDSGRVAAAPAPGQCEYIGGNCRVLVGTVVEPRGGAVEFTGGTCAVNQQANQWVFCEPGVIEASGGGYPPTRGRLVRAQTGHVDVYGGQPSIYQPRTLAAPSGVVEASGARFGVDRGNGVVSRSGLAEFTGSQCSVFRRLSATFNAGDRLDQFYAEAAPGKRASQGLPVNRDDYHFAEPISGRKVNGNVPTATDTVPAEAVAGRIATSGLYTARPDDFDSVVERGLSVDEDLKHGSDSFASAVIVGKRATQAASAVHVTANAVAASSRAARFAITLTPTIKATAWLSATIDCDIGSPEIAVSAEAYIGAAVTMEITTEHTVSAVANDSAVMELERDDSFSAVVAVGISASFRANTACTASAAAELADVAAFNGGLAAASMSASAVCGRRAAMLPAVVPQTFTSAVRRTGPIRMAMAYQMSFSSTATVSADLDVDIPGAPVWLNSSAHFTSRGSRRLRFNTYLANSRRNY